MKGLTIIKYPVNVSPHMISIDATKQQSFSFDFYGEKLGDDEIFLSALAPYVEDGSYLEFEGEDGYSWRWSFKNGKLVEKTIKNSDI